MTLSLTPHTSNLSNQDALPSPALVVFPDRIEANIQLMIDIAGSADRLRPHVKTHKMAEVVQLQQERGIRKFKCATLAEVQMLLSCQVDDILLAMQPVGPDRENLVQLAKSNPNARLSTIVDNLQTLEAIEALCAASQAKIAIYLDINNGMNRTGIAPNALAESLYKRIHESKTVSLGGLHVYDGHIRDSNPSDRTKHCQNDFQAVDDLITRLKNNNLPIPNIVAGGSPSFPVHALKEGRELSPGTTLLWDFGYGDAFADLPFQHAALLFTRVLSKPADDFICLDLGHKAVASEMPHPRVRLFGLEDAEFISHSEEHLVLRTKRSAEISVGDSFWGIPKHICPTVALHNKVAVATDGKVSGYWSVAARNRILD